MSDLTISNQLALTLLQKTSPDNSPLKAVIELTMGNAQSGAY